MIHPLTTRTVYVEGDDDVHILQAWFPQITFRAAGGKDQVTSAAEKHKECCGLKDRDFADNAAVDASHAPGSRLILLRRYCIENYLLEPDIIAGAVHAMPAVEAALGAWKDETFAHQQLTRWGAELALYAAANSIIAEWKQVVETDFRRYFGPLPPLSRTQVVEELRRRLEALTRPEDIDGLLEARLGQVQNDIPVWDGLHRWIIGKVLLEEYLYPQVLAQTGISQDRLRDALIEAGKERVPAELQELAARWQS